METTKEEQGIAFKPPVSGSLHPVEDKEWHEIYSAIAHGLSDTDAERHDICYATDNVMNYLKSKGCNDR